MYIYRYIYNIIYIYIYIYIILYIYIYIYITYVQYFDIIFAYIEDLLKNTFIDLHIFNNQCGSFWFFQGIAFKLA